MSEFEKWMNKLIKNEEYGYNFPEENTYPIITKKSKKTSRKERSPSPQKKEEEGLTKKDLEDLEYWEDKMKENDKNQEEYKATGKIDGKKVPLNKRNQVENELMNNSINWRRKIQEIKFRPELKKIIKEIKEAYKKGEITKEERDKMIEGSENTLSNELHLRRRKLEREKNKKPYDEIKAKDIDELKQKILRETSEDFEEYNKGQEYYNINDYENAKKIFMKLYKKSIKSPQYKYVIGSYYSGDTKEEKPKKEKKTYKEQSLMKARSDLKKNGDKYTIDTEMNVRKGLEPKIKKALKKSVITELDKKIEGSGIHGRNIELHEDSSSDEEDIKQYGKIIQHLLKHIKDPKEKVDPDDYNQSIELIKKIMKMKKHI